MPLLSQSPYRRPKWLLNGHLETIYPALFRKVSLFPSHSEKIQTPDEDFLELDWYRQSSSKLVIVSHGLEGNNKRPYVLGMVRAILNAGMDALAWNYRGCGENLNSQPIFYHSGATYDLETVVNHAATQYPEIYLVGFSLGGNLTLKFLGEKGSSLPMLKKGVAISVPLHLGDSCDQISRGENKLYAKRFLKTLIQKVERKSRIFPEIIPPKPLTEIKTLRDFDNWITGPLHGFQDAEDYYQSNSSLHFLDKIEIPTLILNAKNDPFLSPTCFPETQAKKHQKIILETPEHGGHVGFFAHHPKKTYYSEFRAVEFIQSDF